MTSGSNTSPAVLKSLSAIVQDSLNYVTNIVYHNRDYYLALGRFSFYFINNELDKCDATITYAHVERCLLDERKANLL